MAAFATLSLKKASCPNMSLKKAFAILALLAIIGFVQPAEGMESLYWWRVRYWNGKYYYVWQRKHKGWFDELDALEMESLQKAFKKDPSIKEWIHDRSNDGNWWNTDVETRPVWDDQLGVWRFPDPGVADDDWLSEASSLHTPEDSEPEEGWWQSHCWWESPNEPGEGWWQSSTWWHEPASTEPGEGTSGEWTKEDWKQWYNQQPDTWRRYMVRSRPSDLKRLDRRKLERAGEPVPEHLKPHPQVWETKELKQRFKDLLDEAKALASRCEPDVGPPTGPGWKGQRPSFKQPQSKPGEGKGPGPQGKWPPTPPKSLRKAKEDASEQHRQETGSQHSWEPAQPQPQPPSTEAKKKPKTIHEGDEGPQDCPRVDPKPEPAEGPIAEPTADLPEPPSNPAEPEKPPEEGASPQKPKPEQAPEEGAPDEPMPEATGGADEPMPEQSPEEGVPTNTDGSVDF